MFARNLGLGVLFTLVSVAQSSAQVVQYPNGKRIKVLSTRTGANQLSGNQQRYIVTPQNEYYVDPKKEELDREQARARLAYPNEELSENQPEVSRSRYRTELGSGRLR